MRAPKLGGWMPAKAVDLSVCTGAKLEARLVGSGLERVVVVSR